MKHLFYFIALILVATWGIMFFGYNIGGPTHLLLIIASASFLTWMIRNRRKKIY